MMIKRKTKKLKEFDSKITTDFFIEGFELCEQIAYRTYFNRKMPGKDVFCNVIFEFNSTEGLEVDLIKDVFFKSVGFQSTTITEEWLISSIHTHSHTSDNGNFKKFIGLVLLIPTIPSDFISEDLEAIKKLYGYLKARKVCDFNFWTEAEILEEHMKKMKLFNL